MGNIDEFYFFVEFCNFVDSLEASRQIGSLEDQLNSVMSERDDIIVQLSASQDQVQQQEQQLSNLQLVLEQFQAG